MALQLIQRPWRRSHGDDVAIVSRQIGQTGRSRLAEEQRQPLTQRCESHINHGPDDGRVHDSVLAVDRARRQLSMARELNTELTEEERAWLDAELDDH